MPKVLTFSPSELLSHIEIGQVFVHEDTGKEYVLVGRDPWKAYIIRLHWLNELRFGGLKAFFGRRLNRKAK